MDSRDGLEESGLRVFNESTLTSLYELNGLILDWLIECAHGPPDAGPPLTAALRAPLRELTSSARARISRCPICLVDAGLSDSSTLTANERLPPPHRGAAAVYPQALRIARTTLTLAWTVARMSPGAACILFGMTTESARRVVSMGVHRLSELAESRARDLRPAWQGDPAFWLPLLRLEEAPPSKLPSVQVRALQRQLATLVPATAGSDKSR